MYHALGDVIFEGLLGLESLSRTREANFSEHKTVQGKPTLHQLGPKLDKVQISVKMHRHFCIPEDQIAALDQHRLNGEVLSLVTGAGDVIGSFVIQQMSDTVENAASDGSVISATVALTLLEYATIDGATEQFNQAREGAFALSTNSPIVVSDPIPVPSTESSAMDDTMAIGGESDQALTGLKAALANSARDAHERTKATKRLTSMNSSATSAIAQINSLTGDRYTETRTLETELIAIKALIAAVQLVVASDTIANLITAIEGIQAQMAVVRAAAQPLQKFVVIK